MLYVNGIAVAVVELKRSSVELADGVRQLITNQEEIFNKAFFSTVQLVLAGSDSQGLRYGSRGFRLKSSMMSAMMRCLRSPALISFSSVAQVLRRIAFWRLFNPLVFRSNHASWRLATSAAAARREPRI